MPYFVGEVVPLCDQPLQDEQLVSTQVEQLSQTIRVSWLWVACSSGFRADIAIHCCERPAAVLVRDAEQCSGLWA